MLAASLAACSGGGAPQTPGAPAPPAQATRVQFTVTFPAQAASSAARRRAYISPSIESLSIAIDGGTATYVNAPAPTGSPQTVTSTVPAPPGNDSFAIGEFDQKNGGGNLLGAVTEMSTVVEGQVNTIVLTVNGELAKIAIEPVPNAFLEGSLAAGFTLVGNLPQTFMAVPEDADGNTIVTPGAIPPLGVKSATPAAIVAAGGKANAFTLQAPTPTANVAVTVSGHNLEGATVSASFNADALAAFYIADFTVQKIRVFDENGTPLSLPEKAFSTLSNPMGIAYVPGSPGSIIVTETSNYAAPYILSFDEQGNAQTLAANAFTGVSQPLFLGYGQGQLFVPNLYDSTLSLFDPNGASVAAAAGGFAKLAQPVAATYDADNGLVYVSNEGNDTIDAFTPAGVLKGSASTGSHPMGIAYDSNNKSLYVAYGGTEGDALDAPSVEAPQLSGITEFSETPASVTNTGGFLNASAATFFTGMAFDPYTKEVYAADAGTSTIDAFTETGTPVILATGAFSTISATTTPPSDPMAIVLVP